MPRTKLFYNYFKEYDNWVIYIFHTFQSELNSVKKVIPDNRNGIEMGVGSYILSEEFKKALKLEPIILKPWDPMGSLAFCNESYNS